VVLGALSANVTDPVAPDASDVDADGENAAVQPVGRAVVSANAAGLQFAPLLLVTVTLYVITVIEETDVVGG
jgi:hypothetical protein